MATAKDQAPLAERRRPQSFGDLLGQDALWTETAALRRLVTNGSFSSLILWGPPGCGKTSLALLAGKHLARPVVLLSAVSTGVKELRAELGRSQEALEAGGVAALLFMDEIHRLNKAQQDVLLPALEAGAVKFIGATTENPSFEVNRAVLSRSLVFRLQPLSDEALVKVCQRALADPHLPRRDVKDEVLGVIARAASGDARRALNLLEALLASAPEEPSPVGLEALAPFVDKALLAYDKNADMHYDVISAFIKSIRASHPDAAIHYLARMIEAGEDPVFIARRLVIAASEDVGNANPTALLVAVAAFEAATAVGLPEARIALAQATTYLAASPKSNRAYRAIDKALADLTQAGPLEVPLHLRNAPTKLKKEFGYGANYAYAHDELQRAKELTYLPEALRGRRYYEPLEIGAEKQLKETLARLRPTQD